jgi:Methyltransferase domain
VPQAGLTAAGREAMAVSPNRRRGRGGKRRSKWRDNDLFAFQVLQGLPGGYLPWSKCSLRPSALVVVLNDILTNGRRTIVECGSGVSTVYMARLLRGHDGHIHALEHDAGWASTVERMLEAEGLSEAVSILHAPLEPHPLALDGNDWYAPHVAEELLGLSPDLLLIDGPHGGAKRKLARYPALPFFRPILGESSTVVLDDIQRPGEQELLGRWEEETGMEFRRLNRLSIAVASDGFLSTL